MTVDTRTVDVNVDRFDARYDDLASTKNTENRRKPTPQGNKQKFTQRGQRQRQQFQKGKRRDRVRAPAAHPAGKGPQRTAEGDDPR